MKVRQGYEVTIKEIDGTTVEMVVISKSDNDKVRMRNEYVIAKHEGESAEDVCVRTFPHAFEGAVQLQQTADTPTPVSPTITSPNDSVDQNPTLPQ